eukprot:CAMPEP_0172490558 /NCGR_PEP_ID=MMETSP1066-20121228/21031_1 /TAXON_ID=671091 /ORGANISM="Coscinodiscus wailesii, Strain CCMP2513" /LENGTH=313 /DNA_ID=CAMNT_0013259085 /DNA_START=100 /DNA_END=1041 /DNA_ORIENTATION=+
MPAAADIELKRLSPRQNTRHDGHDNASTASFAFDVESTSRHSSEIEKPGTSKRSSDATSASSVTLTQKMLAEAVGTCLLVFFGCGSVCALVYTSALKGLGQATTIWTLGATLAVYSSASISGAHLNPAVSLAFALFRRNQFSWGHLAPYWLAQLIGAFMGSAALYGIFSKAIENWEKENGITRGVESTAFGFGAYWSPDVGGPVQAFLTELMGTAMLTFIIFSVTHKKNNVPAAAVPAIVGAAIGSIIAIIGSLSGGAINPARDLGPRIVAAMVGWGTDAFKGLGVYLLGPIVGGPLGGLISDKMLRSKRFSS